jgi:hypothetical protein
LGDVAFFGWRSAFSAAISPPHDAGFSPRAFRSSHTSWREQKISAGRRFAHATTGAIRGSTEIQFQKGLLSPAGFSALSATVSVPLSSETFSSRKRAEGALSSFTFLGSLGKKGYSDFIGLLHLYDLELLKHFPPRPGDAKFR